MNEPMESSGNLTWTRRSFFGIGGWVAILACLQAGAVALVTLLFPRVLFEAPTSFKAGQPTDFQVGEVSDRFMKSHRVWIVRESTGLYALLAVCTHLGCTPRWLAAEGKFKCPCHGSGFRRDGQQFEGPAPRALERVRVTRAEDGQLVVDTAVKYRREADEWSRPGAFLPFEAKPSA